MNDGNTKGADIKMKKRFGRCIKRSKSKETEEISGKE